MARSCGMCVLLLFLSMFVAGCGEDEQELPKLWVSTQSLEFKHGIHTAHFAIMNNGEGSMAVQIDSAVVDIPTPRFALSAGNDQVVAATLKPEVVQTAYGLVEGLILVSAGIAGHATIQVTADLSPPGQDGDGEPNDGDVPDLKRHAAAADAMALYLFDEGAGGTTTDTSGHGNNGTLMEGPAWVDGMVGRALQFDGAVAYVDCGNDASLDAGDEITLTAWAKVLGNGTGNGIIMLKGEPDGTPGASYGFVFGVGPQKFSFSLNTEGTGWADHNADDTADVDTWYHLAGTYKPGELILYVDGEPAATVWDHRTGPIQQVGGPLYIGRENSWAQEQFFGVVDELAIFDGALSQTEIQNIMNGGLVSVVMAVEPEGKLGATWGELKSRMQ